MKEGGWEKKMEKNEEEKKRPTGRSDALTHVDVLGQKVVGGLVFLDEVGVDAGAGECGPDEEAEESVRVLALKR